MTVVRPLVFCAVSSVYAPPVVFTESSSAAETETSGERLATSCQETQVSPRPSQHPRRLLKSDFMIPVFVLDKRQLE